MTINELRELAVSRFGEGLRGATPEELARFLAEIQPRLPGTQHTTGTLVVDGAPPTYEDAMREYFAEMLAARPERAAASLWVTAVEMWVDAVLAVRDTDTRAPGRDA
jgi:hypothetical protein